MLFDIHVMTLTPSHVLAALLILFSYNYYFVKIKIIHDGDGVPELVY